MDEATRQAVEAAKKRIDALAAEKQEKVNAAIRQSAEKGTPSVVPQLKEHITDFSDCMKTNAGIDPMLAAHLCNEKASQSRGKAKGR